ncbi:hypothetical protein [Phenylobacterium sp.]|jgi:hypothetical protein|uniref:hypothetical protein n=1 Tax=Phenylobacterium sp. TaxID=1871053 RepID=UPI002E30D4D1|nr:hypothetical protein [Phenylobacterium sp.]HEX2560969.1 hypothetical protein [Phenylobacterium sp.]
MAFLSDRRNALVLGGGAAALLAGLGLAAILVLQGPKEPAAPPPASQAGLVVETTDTDERVSATRPLRCFVDGQFVGELTLSACAKRNGVATDALDVGVDETGALAAANQAGASIVPLPPISEATSAGLDGPSQAAQTPAGAPAQARPAGPSAPCWRYSGAEWRKLPDMTLNACVQTLYAGRCERPGAASYGRWGQQTLRLVPGRVEVSADNRSFRRLAEQGPACSIPAVG